LISSHHVTDPPSLPTPTDSEVHPNTVTRPEEFPANNLASKPKLIRSTISDTLIDPLYDNAPRVDELKRALEDVGFDRDYAKKVCLSAGSTSNTLTMVENLLKGFLQMQRLEMSKKDDVISHLKNELAESRCYAEMGDLIRHELKPFASGLITPRWDWSSWIDWWKVPYANHDSDPARHLLLAIDKVKSKEDKQWQWGSNHHYRLFDDVGGWLLFWSKRCRQYHCDPVPQNMSLARRYDYLTHCERTLASGEYVISDEFVARAVRNVVERQLAEFEDVGKGLGRFKKTGEEFRILGASSGRPSWAATSLSI
jgi:hypothetical protein